MLYDHYKLFRFNPLAPLKPRPTIGPLETRPRTNLPAPPATRNLPRPRILGSNLENHGWDLRPRRPAPALIKYRLWRVGTYPVLAYSDVI